MEAKVLEKIAAQQEKTIKLLSRLSEQKHDEKIEVDKKTAFVKNRVFQVRTDSAIPNLSQDPAFFIHVIPAEFNFKNVIDFESRSKNEMIMRTMHPWFEGGYDYLYNFDGFANVIKDTKDYVRSYAQLLRCGVGELYATTLPTTTDPVCNAIDGGMLFAMLTIRIQGIIEILKEFNYNTKYDLYITFVDFKDVIFDNSRFRAFPIAQNNLYFPPVQIDAIQKLSDQTNYTKTLNHIAQSFGMSTRFSNA